MNVFWKAHLAVMSSSSSCCLSCCSCCCCPPTPTGRSWPRSFLGVLQKNRDNITNVGNARVLVFFNFLTWEPQRLPRPPLVMLRRLPLRPTAGRGSRRPFSKIFYVIVFWTFLVNRAFSLTCPESLPDRLRCFCHMEESSATCKWQSGSTFTLFCMQ